MTSRSTRIVPMPYWMRRLPDLSLGKKMAGFSLLVLLLAVANIALVKMMLQDFNGVAATINVAGKMRMLSQRIAYMTLSIEADIGPDSLKAAILQDLDGFEAAFHALQRGGGAFEFEIPKIAEG